MKKITFLLLTVFYSLVGYGQLENFENVTIPNVPADWLVTDNGVGTNQSWRSLNNVQTPPLVRDTKAVFIQQEEIGMGNTSRDFLITKVITVPANGQLRFWARQGLTGNQGTIYEVRYSTNIANQGDISQYQLIEDWTEPEMNTVFSQYEEKVVNLPASTAGQEIYIAFVKVFNQTTVGGSGDRWYLDDINIVQRCPNPGTLDAINIASTTATLTWPGGATGPTNYQYELVFADASQTENGISTNSSSNSVPVGGLEADTGYKYWLRAECSTGNFSDWVGPYYFNTLPFGTKCSDPIEILTLPHETDGNTADYGNSITATQGNFSTCGATPATTNYFTGNDVIYKLVAPQDGFISITLTPGAARASLFVYNECPDIGAACLAGVANTAATPRVINNFQVTEGEDYYIVISSSNATTVAVPYNLIIQYEFCDKPTALATANPTTTGADLSWVDANILPTTSWNIAVQPAGSSIPTGTGQYNTPANGVPSFTVDNLSNPNQSQYQYWVRRLCPDGEFSAWAGPFLFNTLVCAPADQCTFIFRTNDSANNGWNNAKMQVFQNGILMPVTFNGTTVANGLIGNNTTGAVPQDFAVKLCPGIPFELRWQNQGSFPQQCIVRIINSFGQTIHTHNSTPTPPTGNLNGTIAYTSEPVDCITPQCDIAPTNVAVVAGTLSTTTVTIDWEAPATDGYGWDIYIVPSGTGGVPTQTTVPTYSDVTVADKPFAIPNPLNPTFTLTPDTPYDVYVRVVCNSGPNDSPWSSVLTFTTLPTCPKPTALAVPVATITQTGAVLNWTNGSTTDDTWEILLVPGISMTPPTGTPPLNPIPTVPGTPGDGLFYTVGGPLNPTSYEVNNLTAATIYYYYIRTVCPGNDKSTWSGPVVFHTVTCDDATKCEYKFYPTNTAGNSWNNGRMQVRQNGIIITEIGATLINSTNPVIVKLCPDVPFDLFWNTAGTVPENIGITIQNPFLDVIYTKAPGQGTVGTVLYSDITNCTDAPCAKPTDITVSNVGATSVQLTWTDNSEPDSQSFDLYVVETGGAAPTNNPATAPTHTGVQSGYVLSTFNNAPLNPSTSYTFYVRAACAEGATSTWTIQTPVTFITTPLNDLCINATPVTINTGQVCVAENTAKGNTYGSTFATINTTDPLTGAGCNATNQDVWYSFVATSTSHTILISNIVTTPTTANVVLNHSVFSGTCDNMQLLYCSTALISGAPSLVVGNTYYVRVYKSSNVPAQSATFDLCIVSPPANDECAASITVTPNSGQQCLTENVVSSGTLASTNTPIGLAPGSDPLTPVNLCYPGNDDVWFNFVATSTNHTIIVSNVVPTPSNATVKLNYALFSGACGNLNLIFCSNTYTTPTSGLVVGETYYVRVYKTTTNAVQSAKFDICIISPPVNDECVNAIPVTVNSEQFCESQNTVSGTTIGATASNPILDPLLTGAGCGPANRDMWYSFVATASSNMISFSNIVTNPAGLATLKLNHSVFSGTCAGLVKLYCSTDEVSMASGLTPGQTYYVRVYASTTNNDHSISFNLCITSPPANDECPNSIAVTPNSGQVCAPVNMVHGSTLGASASLPILTPPLTGAGCLPNNNDIWYHFVATHNSHAINLSNLVTTPSTSTAKLNYAVFSGTCNNLTKLYCSTTNYSNATGLTPGETYYIRIYSTSTSVQQSISFDLCITSPPVNDDCANAIVAPVNADFSCSNRVFGSTVGATQSIPNTTGTGCTGTNDDVWYKFIAGQETHFINVNILSGNSSTVALSHAVFSGACDTLTLLYCSTQSNSTAMGLIPGQEYYVRIYTAGVAVGDYANFNLCIKSPPPPAENEDCATAMPIIANIGGTCVTFGTGNLIQAGPSGVPNTAPCVGNADDDVWFSFTATSNQHFINLFNVEGTTQNLNHAVYSGTCDNLTRLYCSADNSLTSTNTGFVPGTIYYVRVWSNTNTAQTVVFDICIKSMPTCETSDKVCTSQTNPMLFANTTGGPANMPPIACLQNPRNPTYFYLQVQSSGDLVFNIRQSTDPLNFPTNGAPGLDVDFVAWGPFDSPDSCDEITMGPCTPACPNNTSNPEFYINDLDNSNVIDCSYDAAVTEDLHIYNAVAGQYYVLLITNFSQAAGFIKLIQTNYDAPNSGESTNLCCAVSLGPDIVTCQPSVTLDAVEDVSNAPGSFLWYYNNAIIENATSSTYEATQTGVYRAEGICGLNSAFDEIFVEFLPAVVSTPAADYLVCDDAANDGEATFDLQTITPASVGVDGLLYSISIHATNEDALEPISPIDVTIPFVSVSTTLYIRIQSNSVTDCYAIEPINLVVNTLENSEFEYENAQYCQTGTNPLPVFLNNGIAGNFTATPAGLSINAQTGEINLASSSAGTYTVTNSLNSNGACNPVPTTFVITVTAQKSGVFTYGSTEYCNSGTAAPIFAANGVAGAFTAEPTGLSINATTGVINLADSAFGTYVITNTVAAAGGCEEDVQQFTITVTEATTASISYSGPYCVSSTGIENAIITGNTTGSFTASPSGLSLDPTTGAINPSSSTPGTYTVNYFVPAQGSCDEINAPTSVTILAGPTYEFVHGCDGKYKLTVQPVDNSFDIATATFVWAPGNWSAVPNEPNAIFVNSAGDYQVTITTPDGCSTETDLINLASIGCQIQKGISPNNDNKNDNFDLSGYGVREISIFNRYGTEVYNYSNYVNQWYGQSNSGSELPDGTYFYVFQTADGEKKTGWIYINR